MAKDFLRPNEVNSARNTSDDTAPPDRGFNTPWQEKGNVSVALLTDGASGNHYTRCKCAVLEEPLGRQSNLKEGVSHGARVEGKEADARSKGR